MDLQNEYNTFKTSVINDYPYSVIWDDYVLQPVFDDVYIDVKEQHSHIDFGYYSSNGEGIVKQDYISHYIILAYRFANKIWKMGFNLQADAVYYSYRVRGCIDLYYKAEIDKFFIPEHCLGAVMDRHATYGKLFRIYNGCHIGPFDIMGKDPLEWKHPVFGDYVTMLANSHVYGKSVIGNNVIISIGTTIVNKKVPDNSIVMGTSPNLHIIPNTFDNSSIIKF